MNVLYHYCSNKKGFSMDETRQMIDDYIYFYNDERIRLKNEADAG